MTIVKTIRLNERTNQRLIKMATQLEIDQSPMIDKLLTRALDAIDNGEWKITRTPVRYDIAFHRPQSDQK